MINVDRFLAASRRALSSSEAIGTTHALHGLCGLSRYSAACSPRPSTLNSFDPDAGATMPKLFWNEQKDDLLRRNYHAMGPDRIAALLGTTRRAVINRAHRLNLKAHYPKDRATPSFPPRSWTDGEKRLAHALFEYLHADVGR